MRNANISKIKVPNFEALFLQCNESLISARWNTLKIKPAATIKVLGRNLSVNASVLYASGITTLMQCYDTHITLMMQSVIEYFTWLCCCKIHCTTEYTFTTNIAKKWQLILQENLVKQFANLFKIPVFGSNLLMLYLFYIHWIKIVV